MATPPRGLFLLITTAAAALAAGKEHDLPGWLGETYTGGDKLRGNGAAERDESQWIETISWKPRAYIYHNFLTKDECLHLIHLSAPKMVRSKTVDNNNGSEKLDSARTSSGTFLSRGYDQVVTQIEERLANFAMVPLEHGEGLQILHYEKGQEYQPHFDYFHDKAHMANQRIATVLMYLTDVDEGGETIFPNGELITPRKPGEAASYSSCVSNSKNPDGMPAVTPRRGDALLFWSLDLETKTDQHSLHAGCPVVRGDKWSATKWMHVDKYDT